MRNRVVGAEAAAAGLFQTAKVDLRILAAVSCRPIEERRSEARKLLNSLPRSTPLDTTPRAVTIWFRTNKGGVDIPPRLRSRYPTDMVVILEHQYHNLIVTTDSIKVALSFNGVLETVVIPSAVLITVSEQKAGVTIDLRKCGWVP